MINHLKTTEMHLAAVPSRAGVSCDYLRPMPRCSDLIKYILRYAFSCVDKMSILNNPTQSTCLSDDVGSSCNVGTSRSVASCCIVYLTAHLFDNYLIYIFFSRFSGTIQGIAFTLLSSAVIPCRTLRIPSELRRTSCVGSE